MNLVPCLSPSLHRRASCESQQADCLDHAILALRCASGCARQRRPSCRLSIDSVGLATLTAEVTIRTIPLDDGDARRLKVAREPGALDAGALHADTEKRPMAGEPGQELA